MADGSIKIRIGASADRSIDTTFSNIEKRAAKARDAISRMFGSSSAGRGVQQIQTGAEKAFAGVEKASEKAARAQVRAQERATREIERQFQRQARTAEAEAQRATRAQEKSARQQSRAVEQFARRTSDRSVKFLFPPPTGMLGGAKRIVGDIARGAGVDMSIGGSVGRAVSLQSESIGLANQERLATGKSRGFSYYEKLSRDTGDKLGADPAQVGSLMRAFTGKTGDFDALENIAPKLASIGKASGADFQEMGDAAGFVYNQLKLLPGAAEKTITVMRGIAGQTALGAVEMKDYAGQMGRVAANAFRFEGSVDDNILKLSALTQLSMERGATSAADAARGTAAFSNTFGKTARIKAFSKAGVDLFADKAQTTMRDPFEIIKDSFRKTNGNIPQLSNMFADTLGRKPVQSLGAVYSAAGGGEAGIGAVDAAMRKYMDALLTEETERKNLAEIEKGAAAKAQRFQNELDKIVSVTANDLVPAFQAAAPVILQASEAFGGLIKFAAANPGLAITTAIVASIARAGLESAFRRAVENALGGGSGGGSGPGGKRGTTGGGALGAVGMGAAIGIPVAAAIYAEGISDWESTSKATGAAGKDLVNSHGAGLSFALIDAKNKLKEQETERDGVTFGAWSSIKDGLGMGTDAEMKGLRSLIARKEAEFAEFQKTGQLPAGVKLEDGKGKAAAGSKFDPAEIGNAVANGIGAKTLNVRIINAADMHQLPPPTVDPAGRTPPPGR